MRRDSLEIIVDLLEVCEKETSKTNMVYKTNLNFTIAGKYLKFLLKKEWVTENGGRYRITDKGNRFLMKARDIVNVLSEL